MTRTRVSGNVVRLVLALDCRPPAAPVDLVPPELLLPITVSDVGVDIVVVQDPAIDRIVVHALAAWTIDIAMGCEDCGALTLGTSCTCCVDLRESVYDDLDLQDCGTHKAAIRLG